MLINVLLNNNKKKTFEKMSLKNIQRTSQCLQKRKIEMLLNISFKSTKSKKIKILIYNIIQIL